MSADWKTIPGNPAAFKRLSETIRSGTAIAFVGAGASAGLYPLWWDLIRLLGAEAVEQGLATADNQAHWSDPKTKLQQATDNIKQALGIGTYADFLIKTFGPRCGADGKFFTPAHKCLVQLGFHGIVTTNYDPGLLEARKAVRPTPPGSGLGFATWKDQDAVNRWITQVAFSETSCPILFAHGYYERSETIVLGASEYRDTYRSDQPFINLMKALWGRDQLVFVGFGFSDPWLDFIADTAIRETGGRGAAPRHIAIVGLSHKYTSDIRRNIRDAYNADPLFYPVTRAADGTENHTALLSILQELCTETAKSTSKNGRRRRKSPINNGKNAGSPASEVEQASNEPLCATFENSSERRAYLEELEEFIQSELAHAPAVLGALATTAGYDQQLCPTPTALSQFLLRGTDIGKTVSALRKAHEVLQSAKAASDQQEAVVRIINRMIPAVVLPEAVETIRRLRHEPGEAVIPLPAFQLTVAEFVMSGADRRPIAFDTSSRKKRTDWPRGSFYLSDRVECGPEDNADHYEQAVRQLLEAEYGDAHTLRMLQHDPVGKAEHIRDNLQDMPETPYFICDPGSPGRDDAYRNLKRDFKYIVFLQLKRDRDIRKREHELFYNILDLLAPIATEKK